MKDYAPLTLTAHEDVWINIAKKMPDNIKFDILHKLGFGDIHLRFFQSDIEKLMYCLWERRDWGAKVMFQYQIDAYIRSGEWV